VSGTTGPDKKIFNIKNLDINDVLQKGFSMSPKKFFDESTEHSEVKTRIVKKYFWAWANVMIGASNKNYTSKNIGYVDLFAGPGRYQDGTKSTPILILEEAIKRDDMRDRLVSIFNDNDPNNAKSLSIEICNLNDVKLLKYKPEVLNHEMNLDSANLFTKVIPIPTLFFLDPWGYKGLSLNLINNAIKDWGCECIFFFNYNRINMGINNKNVEKHMIALFGESNFYTLQKRIASVNTIEREKAILETICDSIQFRDQKKRFIIPFCFKNDDGTRTKHYLIFVTKNFKGYEIMKDVMAKESSTTIQGVPTFCYCPAHVRQPMLLSFSNPLDELKKMVLSDFAGETISTRELIEKHSIGKPFIKKNYKDVLKELLIAGTISACRENGKSINRGFPDDIIVTFS
jgi:three-Cys-motif partner protein